MEENGKFIRLFGLIFYSFVGFLLALGLIMIGLKYTFRALDHMRWFSLLYTFFIVCFPAILFLFVYIVYAKRTVHHTSKPARYFSYIIFCIAIIAWVYFLILDLFTFFKHFYTNIDRYETYNLAFLSANIGLIFLVGIVQALSTKKEVHWMDKHEQNGEIS
jgi:hypothetical protein